MNREGGGRWIAGRVSANRGAQGSNTLRPTRDGNDRCRRRLGLGYWIAVGIGDEVTIDAHPSFLNVWEVVRDEADRVLVDIPIGIPSGETDEEDLDEGRRRCDVEARERVSSAIGSSVFSIPCREVMRAETYRDAREANEAVLGRGLGSQSWSLVPRIRELDCFLLNADLDVCNSAVSVRESHPEVCFAGLAGGDGGELEVTERKRTEVGVAQRMAVLDTFEWGLVEKYDDMVGRVDETEEQGAWKYRIGASRLDDVLDAMALAVTASVADEQLEFLPLDWDEPPTDECGLPMEIVCPRTADSV